MSRILIVDDESDIRFLLRSVLEESGYEVVEQSTVSEALDYCESNHVDMVITDMILPGRDGAEMIQILKERSPELPIIAIGGHTESVEKAINIGASKIIIKPFGMNVLLHAVRTCMNRKSVGLNRH